MSLRIAVVCFLALAPLFGAEKPNILWIVLEDLSPELGCYGDPYAVTPNIDRLAQQSAIYTRAFSNGGACAPARSTLITGMYPPGIGTHHMRSEGLPPAFVQGFPVYLQQAGYFTSNHAKQDYNWIAPAATWNVNDNDWRSKGWTQRGDRPFFTVINIADTHSSQVYQPWAPWLERREALEPGQRHDPARAVVPPYYPDTPETREILRRYADNATFADQKVGEVLDKLEADGLADSTIVFFYSDHGTGLPRSKSFQFESSTRVPLLVRFPEKFEDLAPVAPGGRVERLVSFVDFPATVLSLAGVQIPKHFQGEAFLGDGRKGFPRQFVFGYRDRMDERYELIRSVRDGRFKYIRNYFPHLPWFHEQTRLYPSTNPLLEIWTQLADAGKLQGPAALYMAHSKPREQVFDLREDPNEIHDLAADPDYAGVLRKMRKAFRAWLFEIQDLGFLPEEEMWLRFEGRAYDAVRADPEAYPIERILAAADLVGARGSSVVARQTELLADADPTVRFWAAVGLTAQREAASPAAEALLKALEDERPSVRTAAAQALCNLGRCGRALPVLLENLRSDQQYVSLRAANALDHLGERARPVLPAMKDFVASSSQLHDREFFGQAPFSHWALRQAIRRLERNAPAAP
ncbi:MAG: sulfatase-like hydrolase/transferase [Acidobacteria bacterium]|nr:sulfatase-like hydrolase/transferase [Acidobacteriota bacterium]